MSGIKERALAALADKQQEKIRALEVANCRLQGEIARLRPAADFYLALQGTIGRNSYALAEPWTDFLALLMLHCTEEDMAAIERIKRAQERALVIDGASVVSGYYQP